MAEKDTFNRTGILSNKWLKEKRHISAYIGLGVSAVCLMVFGPDSFMIPTMAAILSVLAILRKPLEKQEATEK